MSAPLHVGVMGSGSIGCYVGGKLLAADAARVTFVGRPRVKEELAAHGLTVRDGDGERRVEASRVDFHTEASVLAACPIVLCCVKSAATAETAKMLDGIIAGDALVASFQNGVRNPLALGLHLPGRTILPAIVGFNVVSKGGGVFHRGMDGPIALEASSDPRAGELAAALRRAGLPVETPRDIAPDQWTKLLVNLNNAVSALSGAPTQRLLRDAGYRRLVAAVIDEGLGVLRAAGIRPAKLRGVPVEWMPRILRMPTPIVRLVTRAQTRVDPEARSSMWEDLEKRRPTEVDYLNGEIVALAERSSTAAPLNRRIVELVRAAERAERGSPNLSADALSAELAR